jgi:hypothetical protein
MLGDRGTIRRLNSMTKYPSIETYHPIGERGILQPGPPFLTGPYIITEKIDGCNARIILGADGYFIGSREELLHYGEDIIYNPAEGIVDAIDGLAGLLWANWTEFGRSDDEEIIVVFGELFGLSKMPAGRQYSSLGEPAFRVFDMIYYSGDQYRELHNWTPEQIAGWRDHGGQPFQNYASVRNFCNEHMLSMVPIIEQGDAQDLPRTIEETYDWLREKVPVSRAALDTQAGAKAEGVVIREASTNHRRKLRFQDYERTLRKP